jgi:ribosomal protein S18 acetylase RimI-like enzyme
MLADEALAQRIHAHLSWMALQTTNTLSRLQPEWRPLLFQSATASAMYCGPNSPLTKAEGSFDEQVLEQLHEFYRGRTPQYEAVVGPLSGIDSVRAVLARGARPMMWESVLVCDLGERLPDIRFGPEITVERVEQDQLRAWQEVSRRGFFGDDDQQFVRDLSALMTEMDGTERCLARWQGEPAAAAMQMTHDGVAFLGGAATLPEYRARGLQQALLAHRLREAKSRAEFAFLGAQPSSGSERNARRVGFQIAYSTLSLSVPVPAD